jgi:DNA-binding transcriptional LysR family regulator
MEFRQLKCFLAVAECLHFGRAAESVHLSQPALSLQIRALEEELGVQLFFRDHHRTQLTPAGTVLVEDARQILSLCASATQHVQRAALGEVGTVRVGFISTAAALLVPQIVKEFHRLYPGIHLELRNVLTDDQVSQLIAQKLDVGLLRVPLNTAPEIVTNVIHKERFVLLLPVGHPLAGKKPFTMEDLRSEDFIIYTRKLAAGFHDRIMSIFSAAGFCPQITQTVSEMYTLVSLVAAGQGISIAPASVLLHRTKNVIARPLPMKAPLSEIALAYNRENLSPAARHFVRIIMKMYAAGAL